MDKLISKLHVPGVGTPPRYKNTELDKLREKHPYMFDKKKKNTLTLISSGNFSLLE